jgi:hypothetical protein
MLRLHDLENNPQLLIVYMVHIYIGQDYTRGSNPIANTAQTLGNIEIHSLTLWIYRYRSKEANVNVISVIEHHINA